MPLFSEDINNWNDWSKVFQSIPAFSCLVKYIMSKENLPNSELEHLTPGSNAVFKVGRYVIKIYAPKEAGFDQSSDLITELFAMQRAIALHVSTPKLITFGCVEDRYLFNYIITEYLDCTAFSDVQSSMSDDEKTVFANKLRDITDKLNTSCEVFNSIDIINDKERNQRWDKYPLSFKEERKKYINSRSYDEKVFVHGDLCSDNILLSTNGDIYIIDFADSVLAPTFYEHGHIAVELFDFDEALLRGYFGDYSIDELTKTCFEGILIHDFGGDIIRQHIGKPESFRSLDDLYGQIKGRLSGISYVKQH